MASSFYHYVPSLAATIIFAILFSATTGLHLYQIVRTRTWFFIAFCVGGFFEVIGFIGRTISSTETYPNYTMGPYIIQQLFLVLAPSLFAASIYMALGRIVLLTDGDRYLPFVRRQWITRLFVVGDVICFLMQGGGGGLMASDDTQTRNTGETIIVGGLFVQIVFFGCFLIVTVLFHTRLEKGMKNGESRIGTAHRRHLFALYAVSVLIFVRSIVRVVEFLQGFDGYIASNEVFLYVFDAVLMLAAMLIMNWVHPSEVQSLIRGGRMVKGIRMVKISEQPEADMSA